METIKKLTSRFGSEVSTAVRKRGEAQAGKDSTLSSAETDGPFNQIRRHTNKDLMDMVPDKQLEETVLLSCYEYLTENMPAYDVAPMMVGQDLLTPRENDEYKAMKRSGKSTISLSEYLLDCLRKRQDGFLKRFCDILREIKAAKYLGDHIQCVYHEAIEQEGFNRSSCRLSKLSLSDSDISQRSKTPQSNTTTSCTACKELKKQNRQLREQLDEREKDYRQLQDASIKVITRLEDQMKQEEYLFSERKANLKEAITLFGRQCQLTEASAAQQTLKHITNSIQEQNRRDIDPRVAGRRNRADSSDTSSMADSYHAEEEGNQSKSMIHAAISNKTRAAPDKPGLTSSGRYTSQAPPIQQTEPANIGMRRHSTPTQQSAHVDIPVPKMSDTNKESRPKHKPVKEAPQANARVKSPPSTRDFRARKDSNSYPKAARSRSTSSAAFYSTKPGRSQSLKQNDKEGERPESLRLQGYCSPDNQELQIKLNKQRVKAEPHSKNSTEQHSTLKGE